MGLETPKQYLKLKGKFVLEHSVRVFCDHKNIKGVIVIISDGDPYWQSTGLADLDKVITVTGGIERCHSVQNGLRALNDQARPDDWILVHDAARPCLSHDDVNKLITSLQDHPVGGILAIPVRDTMKRGDIDNVISETVSREGLWHALTPQMFRYAVIESAINAALDKQIIVTDEAQAIELSGNSVMLIEGHPVNIKITNQGDLPMAELYLSQLEN